MRQGMNKGPEKTVIVISGPTASGKTDLAIDIALRFGTEILSADSRQCYKELNAGVAKPDPRQLAQVHHHFVNSHSIQENVSAATFESYGLEVARRVFEHKDVLVVTGGTGLYIRAFCRGLDRIPAVPQEVRQQIAADYAAGGLSWLQERLRAEDPDYHGEEWQNPRRLLRALEVKRHTGLSIRHFQQGIGARRPFRTITYAIDLPRAELYERINQRVSRMMEEGLLEEAGRLLPYRNLPALQTLGYLEIFDYLDGKISLDQAVELIRRNTRRYAKRQLTWLRGASGYRWIVPHAETLMQDLRENHRCIPGTPV